MEWLTFTRPDHQAGNIYFFNLIIGVILISDK